MSKKGTTAATAAAMKGKAGSVRHGPSQKHVVNGGHAAGKPHGPTKPIKGSDRGGV